MLGEMSRLDRGKERVMMAVNTQGNLQHLAEKSSGVKYPNAFQSQRKWEQ